MKTHNMRSERAVKKEKKAFSLKAHGIFSNHIASAAFMITAGLVLSGIISDVPPAFNQVFAHTMEESAAEIGNLTQSMTSSLSEVLSQAVVEEESEPVIITHKLPPVNYCPTLAADFCNFKEDNRIEYNYNFDSFVTSLSQEDVQNKLLNSEMIERRRELAEAAGQPVVSSNKNLYLDTYSYQRGKSNIPSTGLDLRLNTSGVPISQMQMPESLTFDENGVPENYLYCIEGKATAYYGGTMTATGSSVRQGVVAVDPREIPYGTEMWIVSDDGQYVYGFARAEDTGGFIEWENGATVDLYMNTYSDCCVWGWRGAKIYILPTSYK